MNYQHHHSSSSIELGQSTISDSTICNACIGSGHPLSHTRDGDKHMGSSLEPDANSSLELNDFRFAIFLAPTNLSTFLSKMTVQEFNSYFRAWCYLFQEWKVSKPYEFFCRVKTHEFVLAIKPEVYMIIKWLVNWSYLQGKAHLFERDIRQGVEPTLQCHPSIQPMVPCFLCGGSGHWPVISLCSCHQQRTVLLVYAKGVCNCHHHIEILGRHHVYVADMVTTETSICFQEISYSWSGRTCLGCS